MSDIDAKAMLGRVVAERYRLDAIIAEGGMGAVYRGEHIHMRKRVAIKLLHPETKELPELVQRFERESIVGAHASHRNVASATDFGKDSDGTYYLIQEHIEGITLRSLLTRGPLEPSRALAIARDVALGLEAIHAIGIVHRDLAPKNVMVSETPPDTVKVIDFGFAKVPVERFANQGPAMALTSKGTVFGTIGFIAPEAAFGMAALGPKADLYALGVIMYEMLAGRHPFEHTDQKKLFQAHTLEEPPPPSRRSPERHIPPAIEAIIMRLLQKAPDDRHQDARELIDELDALDLDASDAVDITAPRIEREPEEASPAPGPSSGSVDVDSQTITAAPKRSTGIYWALLALLAAGAATFYFKPELFGLAPRAPVTTASATTSPPPTVTPSATMSAAPTGSAAPSAAPLAAPSAASVAIERPAEVDGKNVDGWLLILKEASEGQDAGRSLKALDAIATIDPSRFDHPFVIVHAGAGAVLAALGGEASDKQLFDLLVSDRIASAGPDILFRMAAFHGGSRGAERAAALLQDEAVLARGTPALRVTVALRNAACAERHALFDQAARDGDERTLLILNEMYDEYCRGCCLRADPNLLRAIQALRDRIR